MDAPPTARDLMRSHLVTVEPDENLGTAAHLLEMGRLRGVPVLEAGHLVGELCVRDLTTLTRRAFLDEGEEPSPALAGLPVRSAMGPPRACVSPETPADEVARRLVEDTGGYLPVVVGEGRLVGIVTENDMLRAALEAGARPEPPQS
jgi:acetoin utilization protein AcuB